jgi:hypothetical protein
VDVEEGEGEALVAAGVLERVEPDEPDAGERQLQVALEDRGPGLDGVDVPDDLVDAGQVGLEDGLEASLVAAAGEGRKAGPQATDPASLDDGEDQEEERRDREAGDDRSQVVADDGVEVDGRVSSGARWAFRSAVRSSLAPRHRPGLTSPPVYPSRPAAPLSPPARNPARPASQEHQRSMAKRTRYPGRPTTRPGARKPGAAPGGPSARGSAASPSPVLRTGGLTQAELDRAAEIEAELVAREKAAIAENARRRARSGRVDVSLVGDAGTPLSVRASHEYAYVARDVRRIVITGAVMFSILAVLWILVNVVGVGAA